MAYEYRRYLGPALTVDGHKIAPRTVFGYSGNNIIVPDSKRPLHIDDETLEDMITGSRAFLADPTSLFNVTETQAPAIKKPKPVVKNIKPAPAPNPAAALGVEVLDAGMPGGMPTIRMGDNVYTPTAGGVRFDPVGKPDPAPVGKTVPDVPVNKPVPGEYKAQPIPEQDPTDIPDEIYKSDQSDLVQDISTIEAAPDALVRQIQTLLQSKEKDAKAGKKALQFNSGVMMGGTPNNYQVIKLTPFGGATIQVDTIEDDPRKYGRTKQGDYPAPDYFMEDFRNNIVHALGLNVKLPFQRLAVAFCQTETMIITRVISAITYGIVLINPDQIYKYMGGFNSRTVAQAVTHELAHFIDSTMLRNSERMRWQQDLRGKNLHPHQAEMGAATTSAEHFATLAELMVWGNSLRRVYNLNGFEIVNKYFKNRFISDEMLKDNKS